MKNKKGFTLVELVIVIAVIAILAGVMIGTFASVVKKAKESAKMQEMTAQKQEQIANDIDAKLKNAEWLGWTDFEEKLAEALTETMNKATVKLDEGKVKEATNDAVEKAFAKYAASLGQSNTGLTAEQVKYIVETALSNKSYSGVTAEQVKAIINNATSGLSNLSKAQVQAIVDAAQAKNLTVAQVTAAVTNATKDMDLVTTTDLDKKLEEAYDKINTAISAAAKDLKDTALTEADIEALLAKYITNGKPNGDYTWYNANATTMEIKGEKAAEQLVALSTMAKGGTSFAGKTIELPESKKDAEGKIIAIDLTTTDFQPIMDFDGKLVGTKGEDGKAATTVNVNVTPVWNTLDGRNGKTMMNYLKGEEDRKDAVGYGFVASLLDGGVIENINVVLEVNAKDPGNKYTYFGGIVGFLDGGIIRNCKVTGNINAYGRIGGVVGYAKSGTISGVDVSGLTITSNLTTGVNKQTYANIGGIAGYVSAGKLEVTGCTLGTLDKYTVASVPTGNDQGAAPGLLFGVLDGWKNEKSGTTDNNYKKGEWNDTGANTVVTVKSCGEETSTTKLVGWTGERVTLTIEN